MRSRRRCRRQSGETLIESLVAILIAVMSVTMLTSCVLTAANINADNKAADERFYEELRRAEIQRPEDKWKDASVTINFGGTPQTVDITLYGTDTGTFLGYEKKEPAPVVPPGGGP